MQKSHSQDTDSVRRQNSTRNAKKRFVTLETWNIQGSADLAAWTVGVGAGGRDDGWGPLYYEEKFLSTGSMINPSYPTCPGFCWALCPSLF
jgi:hypothetical protein